MERGSPQDGEGDGEEPGYEVGEPKVAQQIAAHRRVGLSSPLRRASAARASET